MSEYASFSTPCLSFAEVEEKVGRTWCWPYRGDTQATTHKRSVHLTYIWCRGQPPSDARVDFDFVSFHCRVYVGYTVAMSADAARSGRSLTDSGYTSITSAWHRHVGIEWEFGISAYGRRLANVGISAAALPKFSRCRPADVNPMIILRMLELFWRILLLLSRDGQA